MASNKDNGGDNQRMSMTKDLIFVIFSSLATHCNWKSPKKLPWPRKSYLTGLLPTFIISPETALPLALHLQNSLSFPPTLYFLKVSTLAIPFAWNILYLHPSPVILCIIAKMPFPQRSFLCVLHR